MMMMMMIQTPDFSPCCVGDYIVSMYT